MVFSPIVSIVLFAASGDSLKLEAEVNEISENTEAVHVIASNASDKCGVGLLMVLFLCDSELQVANQAVIKKWCTLQT